MNTYQIPVGAVVNVVEYMGLSRSEWSGTVTKNDPSSVYIRVAGVDVTRASVADAN